MSALACMALLSCQKENSTPDNGGKEDSDGKDYMSVRFTMSRICGSVKTGSGLYLFSLIP